MAAMASSSTAVAGAAGHASGAIGGATEHAGSGLFEGVLAFSNLGLPGKAFTGQKWSKHEGRLLVLVQDLFHQATDRGRALLGVLLNEVGNLSDLVDDKGRENMDCMLQTGLYDLARRSRTSTGARGRQWRHFVRAST